MPKTRRFRQVFSFKSVNFDTFVVYFTSNGTQKYNIFGFYLIHFEKNVVLFSLTDDSVAGIVLEP